MTMPVAPSVIRGQLIDTDLIEFSGRGEGLTFLAPDPSKIVRHLGLPSPAMMQDLYDLRIDQILDFLAELGTRLDFHKNHYLQEALELTGHTAPITRPILDAAYTRLSRMFDRTFLRDAIDRSVGIDHLEGWVPSKLVNGKMLEVRAFGARGLYIIAGNVPILAGQALIRSALTRGDAIVKTPSNDPFTALAIARTMVDMAPDHPVTKHFSVAYWRGGDEAVEQKLYQPYHVEKIFAWGGFASVKHVTKYIQPGLELISLDPKRSIGIVGPEVLDSEEELKAAAVRIAVDAGGLNQVACGNARVIYVITNEKEGAVDTLRRLGRYVYDEMMHLPEYMSTKPKSYDRELRSHIEALRLEDEWFEVFGGEQDEGCVVISKIPETVDFSDYLADRTVNIVPMDSIDDVARTVDAYTQTVGVYPESLKHKIMDKLALFGAQRFVSLGYALSGSVMDPQDGLEFSRRACKWIMNEISDPAEIARRSGGAIQINGNARKQGLVNVEAVLPGAE